MDSVTISRGWFEKDNRTSSWEDTQPVGRRVFIEQKTVLLCDYLFTYADRVDPAAGYDFTSNRSALAGDHGALILADMKKDRHWQAWEGYDLVNFPRG